MKVYIAIYDLPYESIIERVFSTKELAQKHIDGLSEDYVFKPYLKIKEFDVVDQ